MNPSLISQLAADQQADLTASATQQHLTRQACTIRRATARTAVAQPIRPLRPAARLRAPTAT